MGEKIIVGPINKGLKTDRTPFVIDNDSFPTLINAYQWRGRVKRKRGTQQLGRLTRFFNSSSTAYSSTSTITLDGSGNGNLLTGFSLQTNGNIVPGSVSLVGSSGPTTYTDPAMDGTLSPTGTINYATGAITIAAQAGSTLSAQFQYYPDLPVMGIEDFILDDSAFPGSLAFDTTYSYNILVNSPYSIYDVSFYKNPAASITLPGYVAKTTVSPVKWNGAVYQQFWTANYQGALWATNGITIPFITTNIGMQFKSITAITISAGGPPAIATITIGAGHGLVVGDFVFINEVVGITGINFQTGYVTATGATTITVEFPNATIAGAFVMGNGIVQYLTSQAANPSLDCIRWYDGDPTNGNTANPTLNGKLGWVNFCPPLSNLSYSISDLPAAVYYLVGARMIVPFKDRLLFFGPVVQTSSNNSQIYLQDTVIYSQNGTPYYTCSFTGDPTLATTVYKPILVPVNQTATVNAYFEDLSGYGGFQTAGIDQPITTVSSNEDALIVGFTSLATRFIYTGNDLVPFNFFIINSELGTSSTFSTINLDQGVLTRGNRGFVMTNQTSAQRFDLEIPDGVFEMNLTGNGPEQITAQRDFINEWIYFTYKSNSFNSNYPNATFQFNYRDNSWATFYESYTTYGQFRKRTGIVWSALNYFTWEEWDTPWNSGDDTLLNPVVLGGNQQGFVMVRDVGTGEDNSLYIQNISGTSLVTSPDHGLNTEDYILINGCIGTISTSVNGKIFSIRRIDNNTFYLNPTVPAGTYVGGGTFERIYVPLIQTKQFPVAWDMARKTRLGPQQYLLTTTNNSQVTLYIFLSQSGSYPFNYGPIVPSGGVENSSLIYSTVLYTCPESTNLGLTPANTNLQMIAFPDNFGPFSASTSAQIWHRVNTSLIGDTVQVAISLTDSQIRAVDSNNRPINCYAEIELHSIIFDVSSSSLLA